MTKANELKKKVINGLQNRNYTRLLGNHFSSKEEFFELADLYKAGRVEVFTADEYKVAAEAEIADLKAQGDTETAKELAENLTELLNQEIVLIVD